MHFSAPVGSPAHGLVMAVLVLLGIVVATAVWVYADAKAFSGRGRPIVSSLGSVQLDTPMAWFLACLLMWEMVFPHYIDSRSMS